MFIQTPFLNPERGGVQKVTWNLANQFNNDGHDVFVFTHLSGERPECDFAEVMEGKGNWIDTKVMLEHWIFKIKPDIVVNQMPYEKNFNTVLVKYGSIGNSKLIACIHNSLFSFKLIVEDFVKNLLPPFLKHTIISKQLAIVILLLHKIKHRKELKIIARTHDIINVFTNANLKELSYFWEDFPKEKFRVQANPFVTDQTTVKGNEENTLLFVGRLVQKQKRVFDLPIIWAKVKKHTEFKEDWNFDILGNGPDMNYLKGLFDTETAVELHGFTNPNLFYAKSKIFIMTSAYEGFANAVLEAQSYGLVIVAYNSYGALGEVVNDGKDAVLVEEYNKDKMANEIVKLMNNKKCLDKMSLAARENSRKYQAHKIAFQWYQLFSEL